MGLLTRIVEKGKESGLTLGMIAEKSGVSYDRIKKWSKHMPAADSLCKVAKAIGTTAEELLKEEE